MQPAESYSKTSPWLLDGGLRQVELLLRAVVYPPAEPILITDDERNCRDASCGTGTLLGLSRDRIIGRKIDEFLEPGSRAQIAEDWTPFWANVLTMALRRTPDAIFRTGCSYFLATNAAYLPRPFGAEVSSGRLSIQTFLVPFTLAAVTAYRVLPLMVTLTRPRLAGIVPRCLPSLSKI